MEEIDWTKKFSAVDDTALAEIALRKKIGKGKLVLIIDMGNDCREIAHDLAITLDYPCLIVDGKVVKNEHLKAIDPVGIIIGDGPDKLTANAVSSFDRDILLAEIPVLGIGLGFYLICKLQHVPIIAFGEDNKNEIAILESVDSKCELLHGCKYGQPIIERDSHVVDSSGVIVYKTAFVQGCSAPVAIESGHMHGVRFDITSNSRVATDMRVLCLTNFLYRICDKEVMKAHQILAAA